jgi:hypothetical protein
MQLKEGWLKEQIKATMKENETLPSWMKVPSVEHADIHSYSDI